MVETSNFSQPLPDGVPNVRLANDVSMERSDEIPRFAEASRQMRTTQTTESDSPSCPLTPSRVVVLKATQIRKSYDIGGDRRRVLDGVDFQVAKSECVFLSGPSGSGKSTLLSIMGCLLRCDSGEIEIAGQLVNELTAAETTRFRRERIGFVFQRFQLIRGLSAEDNVAVPLTLQGMSLREARQRSGELLKRVGLELHRHQLPSSMSPGQCQRVAIARAVITSPRLVLADEPTAALDGKSGVEVMEILKELVASTGSATVVVTHDPRILKYADRVCEIENGQFK